MFNIIKLLLLGGVIAAIIYAVQGMNSGKINPQQMVEQEVQKASDAIQQMVNNAYRELTKNITDDVNNAYNETQEEVTQLIKE